MPDLEGYIIDDSNSDPDADPLIPTNPSTSDSADSPSFKLVSRVAPWGVANPPPEVWDACANAFPLHAGARPKDFWGSRELFQRDVDLIDGFVAYHSRIPDENVDPAAPRQFKLWCENWRKEREPGIVRLKIR